MSMSKFIFRPVSTIINALNEPGLLAQRLALFAEGPVVIAVIDYTANARSQCAVVTNFHDTTSYFAPTEWQIGTNVIGYVPAIVDDEVYAHNYAWTMFLNMTHTKLDIECRRSAWHAFKAAVKSNRMFSDLGEDYYDHGVHPTTLDDEAWIESMIRRLDDNIFNERFMHVVGHMKLNRLPQEVLDQIQTLTDGLLEQRPDNFDDEVLYSEDLVQEHLSGNLPNIVDEDGNFPAWDDLDHGLEVRWSRQYEQHWGLGA